jgi:hypothetical protein
MPEYELIDAREHGQNVKRPLLIVELYPWGGQMVRRLLFSMEAQHETEARAIVQTLNESAESRDEELSHAS